MRPSIAFVASCVGGIVLGLLGIAVWLTPSLPGAGESRGFQSLCGLLSIILIATSLYLLSSLRR